MRSLGPGIRSAVWVQGCPFSCPGCVSPGWASFKAAQRITPGELLKKLLLDQTVRGLTISGGEPLLQAVGLTQLVRQARQHQELDVICYTGFTLEQIDLNPGLLPGCLEFLEEVDVLIDGPYLEQLNDNYGLRGSSNQRVHFLTGRLAGYDFENKPRSVEVTIHDGHAFMVGIPPMGVVDRLRDRIHQVLADRD